MTVCGIGCLFINYFGAVQLVTGISRTREEGLVVLRNGARLMTFTRSYTYDLSKSTKRLA